MHAFSLNAFLEVTTSHFETNKLREVANSWASPVMKQGYSPRDTKEQGQVNHMNTAQPGTEEMVCTKSSLKWRKHAFRRLTKKYWRSAGPYSPAIHTIHRQAAQTGQAQHQRRRGHGWSLHQQTPKCLPMLSLQREPTPGRTHGSAQTARLHEAALATHPGRAPCTQVWAPPPLLTGPTGKDGTEQKPLLFTRHLSPYWGQQHGGKEQWKGWTQDCKHTYLGWQQHDVFERLAGVSQKKSNFEQSWRW